MQNRLFLAYSVSSMGHLQNIPLGGPNFAGKLLKYTTQPYCQFSEVIRNEISLNNRAFLYPRGYSHVIWLASTSMITALTSWTVAREASV